MPDEPLTVLSQMVDLLKPFDPVTQVRIVAYVEWLILEGLVNQPEWLEQIRRFEETRRTWADTGSLV